MLILNGVRVRYCKFRIKALRRVKRRCALINTWARQMFIHQPGVIGLSGQRALPFHYPVEAWVRLPWRPERWCRSAADVYIPRDVHVIHDVYGIGSLR